jgi:Ca2+-dependent lipid-binding protein
MRTISYYLQYLLLPFIFLFIFIRGVCGVVVDSVDEVRRDIRNHKLHRRRNEKLGS